ncbi:MAG TPA: L-histidine N(alpha)-methyltransferase [Rhodopila sp.]|uniref:L-histidine N(alpha)-methyltransferase n=1 Tax=Rhodopila sp. TaxID=2480087 RepID=UPI002C4289E1|nr:L-histidine N(alpha)-methyltransferase [Rhodopila sp.]HVY15385.1 L-histidine N(alpha)-methyltransferase [Rhodopila sp.]
MPNDPGFLPRAGAARSTLRPDIAAAALKGLTSQPKTLPPSLFYDELGCHLFYEITKLPEYYLTRTETALMERIGAELLPPGMTHATLVEFGGSEETKARYLLDLPGRFDRYISVDVAETALTEMRKRLAQSHEWLEVVPVVANFMHPLRLPPIDGPRLGFFPGSTIGNLEPSAAAAFLASARQALEPSPWFLLGADLRKSPDILIPAYDDAAGVTAAFNRNLLVRLNREAAADFDVSAFRHRAVWNDGESRIEMHLESLRPQVVHLPGATIRFAAGETIHTENSYKHTPEALVSVAQSAGWRLHRRWTDDQGLFGVFLFGP